MVHSTIEKKLIDPRYVSTAQPVAFLFYILLLSQEAVQGFL